MNLDEAIRVVRDQTIPALRGSGGDGHADALEVVLSEVERLRAQPSVVICLEERALGNGGCGACALCCKEHREAREKAEAELLQLRLLLWLTHGHSGPALYGDDGEMQCSSGGYCDFKRATLDEIRDHLEPFRARESRERWEHLTTPDVYQPTDDPQVIGQEKKS